jgi:hypothetical protein
MGHTTFKDYGWATMAGTNCPRKAEIRQRLSDLNKHLRILVADGLVAGDFSEHEAISELRVSASLVTDVVTNYVRYVKSTPGKSSHYEYR